MRVFAKSYFFGILVLSLIFKFFLFGCDNGTTSGDGGDGTFTITDIPPEYNGYYAYFVAWDFDIDIVGCQSINMATQTVTLSRISNGKVNMPVWRINESSNTATGYSGNGIFYHNTVEIYSTGTLPDAVRPLESIHFDYITFTTGSATKSFNDGAPNSGGIGSGGW